MSSEQRSDSGLKGRLGLSPSELVLGLFSLALALALWLRWPTIANYDSVLDLVWAREILSGQNPGFEGYAASTPHPLWLAIGLPVVAIFGDSGDRVLVLISALSLVALVLGTAKLGSELLPAEARYRSARVWSGLLAGLLALSSFALLLLAARGYLDVPFLALVVWAAAIAARDFSAWRRVSLLLLLAGLLRPEAWILSGAYWLWLSWPQLRQRKLEGQRLVHLSVVLAAPLIWMLMDLLVTGNPIHSLTATGELAKQLGRETGLGSAPKVFAVALADQARPPVAAGGFVGLALLLFGRRIGLPQPPREVKMVLIALLAGGTLTFLASGIAGLSLIPRYLTVPVIGLTALCGLATCGWLALPAGDRARQLWASLAIAGAVLGLGAYVVLKRDSASVLASELRFLANTRSQVRTLLSDPKVVEARRCGPISLPTYRLVPDIRLRLNVDSNAVVARSDPRARSLGALDRGVAITVSGKKATSRYGKADGVPRSTQAAPQGFTKLAQAGDFSAWARCP